ncbi:MAG: hypothetical protein KDD62_04040, partial [Bdellovibrionales bacterium]|nr:hypothetical protein [Bdellovibrionales bacterium]
MNNRFSTPFVSNSRRDKEKLILVAVAGLAFSLILVLLVVLSYRSADAKNQVTPAAVAQIPASVGSVPLFTPRMFIRA